MNTDSNYIISAGSDSSMYIWNINMINSVGDTPKDMSVWSLSDSDACQCSDHDFIRDFIMLEDITIISTDQGYCHI